MIQHKPDLPTPTKDAVQAITLVPVDALLSRKEIATRWGVTTETVKRRCREGLLPAMRFNSRLVRHRMSDVVSIEQNALGGKK